MTQLRISELTVYPIKSARGIAVDTMTLGKLGPDFDRRWMLIDQNGKFITQRQQAKMCLIGTQLKDQHLIVSAPTMPDLEITHTHSLDQALRQSTVWGTAVTGYDCGDDVAEWFSAFLEKPCRLIYMPDDGERKVDTAYANDGERLAYADGFPLLVASQSSLDDFNSKLGIKIGMERFRPNIVISGCEPYAEDHWQKLCIGDIELSLVKPCSRCIIPSIDPQSATKQMEVNEALMRHRRRGNTTFFGQNALYQQFGTIHVGDDVTIL